MISLASKLRLNNLNSRIILSAIRCQSTDPGTTNFGYKEVKTEQKQAEVNKVFTSVAEKYDVMNDLMSLGLHRAWKNHFISEISPNYQMKLIDVAGGTGDIAFRFMQHLENSTSQKTLTDKLKEQNTMGESSEFKITVCDINESMLKVGEMRASKLPFADRLEWKVGNAEDLVNEKDESYDVYTIAFGIRNCTNLDKVIKEAYRVLKPGGRFLVMEFSKIDNVLLKKVYDFYSFEIIPVTGYMVAGDWDSYQYLVESIRMFPTQDKFAKLIKDCGSITSSVIPSPTLNTPRERPSPPSMSSMLSRDRAEPFTVSADELFECASHCCSQTYRY